MSIRDNLGGGESSGDVLDTLEEIEANTESGKAAGALAVKELNDSLVAEDNLKFQFATDGEGNYGYLGADDSFIPFKSVSFEKVGAFADNASVEIGKKYLILAYYTGTSDIPTPIGCEIIKQSDNIKAASSGGHSGRFLYVKATSNTINIKDRYIFLIEM